MQFLPNPDKENEPERETEITDSVVGVITASRSKKMLHYLSLHWYKKEGCRTIKFEDVPFLNGEAKILDCQPGPKYYQTKIPARKASLVARHTKNRL